MKKIYKDHKASVQTDVESNVIEIKKETKQGDPLSSLLFNAVLQNSLKEVTQRWQKKKRMGIYLSDHDHDCLTNLRFADDVLLFATSKEQLHKMMYEFKESGSTQERQKKVLSNQSSFSPDSKKSVRYLGQLITFQQQETTEIKKRIRTAWATFHKYRQDLTLKEILAQTPSPTVRRSNNSDDMLRIGNMGTHQRA